MIEESGRVVALKGSQVWVQSLNQSACQSCKMRGGCGQRLMVDMIGGATTKWIHVDNAVHARLGDQVRLGIEESALLRASALVYLVPILALIGGALVGDRLMALGDAGTAAVAVLAMAISLALNRMFQGKAVSRQFTPVLLRIQEAPFPAEDAGRW